MALAHLTNIGETARGRLLSQYAGATKFIADIAVVVAEAQELEDAFWAFLEELDLDAASGVWLDVIGGLIGEHRDGAEDDPYRLLIAARILANKSAGSTDELLAIVTPLLLYIAAPDLTLVDWYPASQTIRIYEPPLGGQTGDDTLNRICKLLHSAKAAAVRFLCIYQDDVTENMFTFCSEAGGDFPGKGFDNASRTANGGRLAGVRKI